MSRFLPFFLLAAAAAGQTPSPLNCFANAGVPPVVRAEDFTALTGDLVITCVGGDPSQRTTVDITLSLNTNITARLMSAQVSEAELLIDEPGLARLDASGNVSSVTTPFCVSPNAASNSQPAACNPARAGETYQQGTYTMFHGAPSAPNAIKWAGIPVVPPGKDGQRTFRLVNVRANAAGLGPSASLIPSQILAYLSTTGLPIDNPQQTVGYVQTGVLFDVRSCDGANQNSGTTFTQCSPTQAQRDFYDNPTRSGTLPTNGALRFREAFQSAFKPLAVDGQQTSIPGVVYNTESGFVRPETASTGTADSGTRLGVQFRNIPAGVRIFVSRTQAAGSTDKSKATFVGNNLPAATSSLSCGNNSTQAIEVPLTNGTGSAVWEVIDSDPNANEVLLFTYAIAYRETGTALGKGDSVGSLAPSFDATDTTTTMQPSTVAVPRFKARAVVDDILYMNACGANVTIISKPDGTPVWVDGILRATPATFAWAAGEAHLIEGRTYGHAAGSRRRFTGWSTGGSAQQTYVTPAQPVTIIANFVQQHAVSLTAGAGGSASATPSIPADGYEDEGRWFTFEAVPSPGNVIAGWTGVDPVAVGKKNVTITGPVSATVTFKPGSCAARIDPAVLIMPYGGAPRSVSVVRDPACGERLSHSPAGSWIAPTSTTGEAGRWTVWLAATPNQGTTPRSMTLFIADAPVSVSQQAPGCVSSLSTSFVNPPADGQAGQLSLTSPSCAWTASSDRAWLQVYPLSGTGSGPLHYNVFANFSSIERTATLNVGNNVVEFRQLPAQQLTGHSDQERARFVRRLYYNYLGRLPLDNELQFHVASGQPREQLALNFLNSAEFNNGGRFVAGLYIGILDRDAEYGGWLFQRDALVRNITNHDTMVSTFINGPEFTGKYGTLSNAVFTQLMYQQILGRPASAEEVAWRVSLLAGGFTRVAMARDLLNSAEFRQGKNARLMSFLLHATILNRDPTTAEFNARRDQVAAAPTEATTRAILAELVQSVEVKAQVQ